MTAYNPWPVGSEWWWKSLTPEERYQEGYRRGYADRMSGCSDWCPFRYATPESEGWHAGYESVGLIGVLRV